MQIPTKVIFDHAETLGELDPEFQPVIDRLQKRIVDPNDADKVVDILESLLPDDLVMFPEAANTHVDDKGTIRFEITAYKIDNVA